MPTGLRRLALLTHVAASVGWFGAVVAFTVLALVGATSGEEGVVRAVWIAAEPMARWAIVPLAITALLSGLVCSLGTTWGLVRHYWVMCKLALTVLALVVLWLYLPTLAHLAAEASDPDVPAAQLRGLGRSPLLHAGGALLVLTTTMVLGVYKPRGMTRYGWAARNRR